MNETDERAIEEMAHDLCGRCQDGICVVDGKPCNLDLDCTCQINATTLYNAGYRKQSGWISVEERWPETDGYYLVWNNEQRKIEIRFFHRLSPYYPVETYPEIRAYFGNCSDHKSITHWMPLPEPPKGE